MDTGRFKLLTQLGAGPDGVAYTAEDPESGDTVGFHLLTTLDADPVRRPQLVRQTRLLQLVDDPAVCKLRLANFNAAEPYLVTDCPPQRTLQDVGSAAYQNSPIEVLKTGERLAQALAAIHRVGMVHGNLIPSRVWFDDSPQIDVLPVDDGRFPKPHDGLTGSRLVDPRQAEFGASGDIYSLASLMYWLTAGEPQDGPLTSESGSNLQVNWSQDDRIRRVAGRLRELLATMLSPDDLDRPGAREVADQLAEMISQISGSVWDQTLQTQSDSVTEATVIREPDQARTPEMLGRFRIISLLGQGGMGSVYKAEDPVDQSIVAIKALKPAIAADPKQRRRFLKEARVLSEIQNPHVTRFIEANEDNGVAYLAIEFVSGPSVGSYLFDNGAFSELDAISITSDVARALSDAHQRGIIHRDIKPDNILLSRLEDENGAEAAAVPAADELTTTVADIQPQTPAPSDQTAVDIGSTMVMEPDREAATSPTFHARLTDFGLARHQDQSESMNLTQAGTVLGTPLYMSPEQWQGATVDARADVYSLGVTFYYMLAGQPPYLADQMSVLMSKHLNEPVPSLQRTNANISDGVVAIIEKAVAKDPNDRYQDASEMLDDLEHVLKGEPTSIVLHPQLPPLADDARFMSWEFQWELSSRPDQLWPYVSNTDRFNRAMGLPPATFRTEVDAGVGVRRFAEVKVGPLVMAWEEHPFEWIEGRRFGVLREFSKGPFVWFISKTELSERPTGGTLVTHSFRIEPRGVTGRIATKIQMGRQTQNALDRIYHRIDQVAGSRSVDDDAFEEQKRSRPATQLRMEERVESLINSGAPAEVSDRLGQFLLEAPDQEVARIRPIALARRFGFEERDVIETCLRGVREGILSLIWDVLCPVCRVPSDVKDTLKALSEHEHCPACNIDFESDFSSNVELIFRVHPEIRRVTTGTYCIGGPANFPHIVAQTRLRPDERVKWNLAMPAGSYRMRSPNLPYTIDFHVSDSRGVSRWDVDLGGPRPDAPPPLDPTRQALVLHNLTRQELLARIERTTQRDDVLTAAQASSLALFRDLFPSEILAPGQLANVTRVTLMALSVGRLESVYSVEGDTGTFAVVHECLQIADKAIRQEGGAVVKIIGDGFLAAFEEPAGAVRTALDLPQAIAESPSTRGLPIKIALHRGDAMMTTINDRLDYFGMTVNSVFDLLKTGEPGDLLVTQSVSRDPAVVEVVQERSHRCEVVQDQRIGPQNEPVLRLLKSE